MSEQTKIIPQGKIVNVQWGLLSAETLTDISIGNLDVINNKKNVAIKGSVLDGGLGPLNAFNLCQNCGSDVEHCTGHFGSIELFQPCINVFFLAVVPKILSCICLRCSRLLVSPAQRLRLKTSHAESFKKKVAELFNLTQRNRSCWFSPNTKIPKLLSYEEACEVGYCGFRQPDIWIRDEKVLLRPTFYLDDPSDISNLPVITPMHLYQVLKNVDKQTCEMFGFRSGLDCMFFYQLPVPPMSIRPSRTALSEDDLTKNYKDVEAANQEALRDVVPNLTLALLRTDQQKGAKGVQTALARSKMTRMEVGPLSVTYVRKKKGVIPLCLDSFFNLQRKVAAILDANCRTKLESEYGGGRDRLALKQRYTSNATHAGRVREMMNGKRVDLSGRSVISPDTEQDVNEIGIPKKQALTWGRPWVVNTFNYMHMFHACLNGEHRFPGLNFVSRSNEKWLPDARCGGLRLGDIAYKHLEDGEDILFNRQPSLHKHSIMGAKAKIHDDDTTKLHLAVTPPLGADFDGDEITTHLPHDTLSCAEVQTLMAVEENMMKEGHLIIGFVQHAVIGVYKLTSENECIFSYQDVFQWTMRGNNMELTEEIMGRWPKGAIRINGKQAFQMMLTTYDGKQVLDRSKLNALMFLKMQQTSSNCVKLLSFLTRVLEQYTLECGVSIQLKDYIVPIPQQTRDQVATICNHANKVSEMVKTEEEERAIVASLSRIREMLAKDLISALQRRKFPNGLLDVIFSGSKGNLTHIAQSAVMVGIQVNQFNQLIQLTLNHFFQTNLQRLAFIPRSFLNGLTPLEFYYHLTSVRIGLIGTALNTADTGYLYRRLWKFLEDLRVVFDGSVRNAQGQIIMMQYGFDTTMLIVRPLHLLSLTNEQIQNQYRTDDSESSLLEVQRLLSLRKRLLSYKYVDEKVAVPVDLKVVSHLISTNPEITGTRISFTNARHAVNELWMRMVTDYHIPNNDAQEAFYFEMMSTSHLLQLGILQDQTTFRNVLEAVFNRYKACLCHDGTPVGLNASHGVMEPLSQGQLKRMAVSGEATTLVAGIVRLKEIFNLVPKIQTPWMQIGIKKEHEDKFHASQQLLELNLDSIVTHWSDELRHGSCIVCHSYSRECVKDTKLVYVHLTLFLDKIKMAKDHRLKPEVLGQKLISCSKLLERDLENIHMTYTTNLQDDEWFLSLFIPPGSKIFSFEKTGSLSERLLASQLHCALKHEQTLLGGIKGIRKCVKTTKKVKIVDKHDNLVLEDRVVYETLGSNLLDVCMLPEVDITLTTTNDINQTYQVFGIDAAMRSIERNLYETMVSSNAAISRKHISLIAQTMCYTGKPVPMTFAGMVSKENPSYLKMSTFERCLENFIAAGVSGQIDHLRGLSESNFVGTQMSLGTGGDFRLLTEENMLPKTTSENWNIIKRNLRKASYLIPDMDQIETELQRNEEIPLELTPIAKMKKVNKSAKRKQLDDALKWGPFTTEDFPSSPKRNRPDISSNNILWNLASTFAPSSP